MKRHIVKHSLALAMALVLAFGSTNVYASTSDKANKAAQVEADKDEDNVLTVDDAVSKAISYSRTLKTLYESNELNKVMEDDTRIDLIWSNEYTTVTNLNVELKNLLNNIRNYDSNVAIEKEKIRLNVIQLFAAIINAEDNLDLYDEELALSDKDLEIAKVKLNLGLLSSTDYDALVTSYNKTKSDRQALESSIAEAYNSLNSILGQDLSKRYTVELDIDYEQLGEVDVDFAVAKAVSSSQSIVEKTEAAEIAKYQLDVYSSDWSNDKKESKQNNYNQATRSLADAKTNMETSLRKVFNSIQTSETDYANSLATIEQKEKELAVLAEKLRLGKITQLEYDKSEYELNKLKTNLKQSVYSHYVLVSQFNNPDLLG
jgi:hypothetical protein